MKGTVRAISLGLSVLFAPILPGSIDEALRPALSAQEAVWPAKTFYKYATVKGRRLFYREAGDPQKTTIVLLHGYPSSSHTYRELIPLLSGRFHVIAPDHPGSGYSEGPDPEKTRYSFDLLAEHIDALLRQLKVQKFVLYMQDFGAPVGFRLMLRDPARIQAVVAQNANAYIEGISRGRLKFFRQANLDRSPENIERVYGATGPDAVKYKQYLRDVKNRPEIMSPDAWTHDIRFLNSRSQRQIQLQLFQDYKSNLDAYPKWQALLRRQKYPTLLVWGKHDPVFIPAGAKAYLKDVPDAELHLLDAGHFAVEEQAVAIAKHIVRFLDKTLQPR